MASRDGGEGDLVEAAAWRLAPRPRPRQTAREVISEATARTASSEGSTARPGAAGAVRPAADGRGSGVVMTGPTVARQTSMPNRRAERARWRAERSRRRRLTSIGSTGERLGTVDQRVEHLVVAGGRHVEQLADRLLLGARVLPPLPLEGEDLLVAGGQLRRGIRRRSAGRRWRRPWGSSRVTAGGRHFRAGCPASS